MKHIFFCLVHAAALSLAAPAFASPFYPTEAAVFFSPNGGAENAIVRSIDSAKSRIRMQAFLFSNKEITGALIRAHQRGVKVDVIIDKKMPKKKPNTTEDLIEAGVPTFFDTAHRTAHDKIIIVDDDIVLTGSFNFVKVAETKNGENLLISRSPRNMSKTGRSISLTPFRQRQKKRKAPKCLSQKLKINASACRS